MKFTLSWLKDHLETDAGLDAIVETLTRIGLEVEGVETRGAAVVGFRVARVVTAEQHPNADRLRLLSVDVGEAEPIQVVCGAPNARAGLVGVFASPGTVIPVSGTRLEIGTIRGLESRGMMCSERELLLSDSHEGIIELPADAPVGVDYAAWAGLDDPVIDVAITPNRPDCLGVVGIARDLAAAGLGTLRSLEIGAVHGAFPCPVEVTLDLGDVPEWCPAFALRLVRGVRNGPSPDWMQRRLKAIGLRPINALVDVTNYMTFDRGRPLHVFDAAKVSGNLVVRRGRKGESLLALDGRTYALDESICVISDDRAVESLAGVMGGEDSGVSEETTDVLIESALWDPLNIARTGRSLGLNSDARYRFERGIDPALTLPGLDMATQLVIDICGGEASAATLAGAVPEPRRQIEFPLSEVERLCGITVAPEEIEAILGRLGFAVEGEGAVRTVTVPSWRPDVGGKADLVEEVMRIVGVDAIPHTPLPRLAPVSERVLTPFQTRVRRTRRTLAARGLVEAVTWSFVSKAAASAFGGGMPELALANPIAADLSDMRPSLLPGLASAARRNGDRGLGDVALFEVGQIFFGAHPSDQKTAAAGLRRGTAGLMGAGRAWTGAAKPVDVFDAKADALAALDAMGGPADRVQITADAPYWYHPGRSGTLRLGPVVLGHFGELHPEILELLDMDGPVAVFELILDAVPAQKAKATKSKSPLELSGLMPVKRDFAFVVADAVKAADLIKAVSGADKKLIAGVQVFDIYAGKGIEPGKKSVALEVTLQPGDKTLTDKDLEAVAGRIVAAVTKATGAVLRA